MQMIFLKFSDLLGETEIENRYYIEQGLRLGVFIFNRLYEDLYNARERRIFRDVCGPHTRAS